MEFEFPFEVPADLTALSAEEFATYATQARDHARQALSADETAPAALIAYRDLLTGVGTEETRRTDEAASAADARAALATLTATPVVPPVAIVPTEILPAAPAAVPPVVASTIDTPPAVERESVGSLIAAADAPNRTGELSSFAQVGELLDTQFKRYGRVPEGARGKDPIVPGGNRFAIGGRSMTRHNIAMVQREYPAEFRITDPSKAHAVLEHVRNESRLPGGSLAASMLKNVKAGKSLTAAAGWCAPSEILYDLCSLSSLDGMLDIPTIQASRGGFQIPTNGGPDFATIYNAIGDAGDVILTEYEVQNGADKVCTEIPCPPFQDVRLDVAYLCITGALLQERGYPEAVTQFTQEAITALAHKVNASMIARLVAGSTAPVTIPEPASSDDAASNLLAAVELAIWDQRYRNRRELSATSEVVFPAWVLGPIRASMSRREGIAEMAVTNEMIMNWFAVRGARPQFVYDWQDAFTGGAFGGSASATAFPTTVTFMVYPAGTWVKAEQDVINLDTIYDNALLTQNQFTALFVEDGLAALKMCRDSRLYTTDVIPNGVVAARTLTA